APAPRAAAGPAVKAALGPARTRLKNMLTDIASLEEAPFERVLRRYTEFVGSDGKARWAESVDGMSEAWAERSLAPAERDWRAVVPWSAEASQVPALVS
ncbi:MAG: hypothetical protein HY721_25190, partial [Planctomycetes bacterium]|nr:hypothetical protein [Planctomycetota bacterium]